jgi:hypothetical protein
VHRRLRIALIIVGIIVVLFGLAVFAYWRLGQLPEPAPVKVDSIAKRPAPADTDDVDAAKSLLKDLMGAEDLFVADSTRFTDDLRQLVLARGDTTRVFTNPTGFSAPVLTATGEGWTAVVTSAKHKCGIVIGQIPNPVEPTAPEREPVCVAK